jgi:hypothetical protein
MYLHLLDFKSSPYSESCFLLGISPGVRLSFADISEPSVRSIFKGLMKNLHLANKFLYTKKYATKYAVLSPQHVSGTNMPIIRSTISEYLPLLGGRTWKTAWVVGFLE